MIGWYWAEGVILKIYQKILSLIAVVKQSVCWACIRPIYFVNPYLMSRPCNTNILVFFFVNENILSMLNKFPFTPPPPPRHISYVYVYISHSCVCVCRLKFPLKHSIFSSFYANTRHFFFASVCLQNVPIHIPVSAEYA